jgi:hypothetical protein
MRVREAALAAALGLVTVSSADRSGLYGARTAP